MLCSLIFFFLMVDQLIKSNEHLIGAKELPLSAFLMIFIFVSIAIKLMRLILITIAALSLSHFLCFSWVMSVKCNSKFWSNCPNAIL
jgi:hypothetical protein